MKQFIFNIAWRQKLSLTKKSLLQHDRVYQVIVFFPKTTNKWQGKNDQEIFRDQISIQRFEEFLLRSEKQTNSFHELGNVTGVIISSSTCSDIMTYNVYFVFMQINFTKTEKTQVRMTSKKFWDYRLFLFFVGAK